MLNEPHTALNSTGIKYLLNTFDHFLLLETLPPVTSTASLAQWNTFQKFISYEAFDIPGKINYGPLFQLSCGFLLDTSKAKLYLFMVSFKVSSIMLGME